MQLLLDMTPGPAFFIPLALIILALVFVPVYILRLGSKNKDLRKQNDAFKKERDELII